MGKKRGAQCVAANYALHTKSRRLFVKDKVTRLSFLVDTGSEVSILPASLHQRSLPSILTLTAANSSSIPVYGRKNLILDLGLGKPFRAMDPFNSQCKYTHFRCRFFILF